VSEYKIIPNKQLSYSAAYVEFKNLLKYCDLEPSLYGLHSARIGAATDAFMSNVPGFLINAKGRWKSEKSKYSYLRVPDPVVCQVGTEYSY
jgi:hypothetical protein